MKNPNKFIGSLMAGIILAMMMIASTPKAFAAANDETWTSVSLAGRCVYSGASIGLTAYPTGITYCANSAGAAYAGAQSQNPGFIVRGYVRAPSTATAVRVYLDAVGENPKAEYQLGGVWYVALGGLEVVNEPQAVTLYLAAIAFLLSVFGGMMVGFKTFANTAHAGGES